MSGQLIWRERGHKLVVGGHPIPGGLEELPNKYSHVIFPTTRGTLFFNDQRQFGYLRLMPTAHLEAWLTQQGFGPEPLEPEFTPDHFFEILRQHRVKRIKPTLMDQTVIAGIGNIYADEACHYARIRPSRRIYTLNTEERRALFRGIRHVLRLSIRHHGTTARSYRTASGRKGEMNKFLRVYGRTGRPCPRCGFPIKKIVLAQRGTHFCPNCQR